MTLLARCICGSEAVKVGSAVVSPVVPTNVPIISCPDCDVVRQDVTLTPAQLQEWYAARYHEGIYKHTLRHDMNVAATRLHAYNLPAGIKLLDVGAGNGAFVNEARAGGIDAWGQDLAKQSESPYIYVGDLEHLYFPTAEFDVVTLHDVLEHVPDPVAFLQEVKRILKPVTGQLIVDFPRFWDAAGAHHWKLIEHLWMFTEQQLVRLLKRVGFTNASGGYIVDVVHPIPSKVVVRCYAPMVNRVSILVPAGIGDAYWVMTKLRGFMRQHGIVDPPSVYVQDAGGPKRTEPFLKTIPFVHAAGYVPLRTKNNIWKEAYLCDARTVYERPFAEASFLDWFIAYNGIMRFGKSLNDVDPQWPVEWHLPMHISKEALAFKAECQRDGPYALVYITDAGMYQEWLKAFTPEQLRDALRMIEKRLGLRMIFIGAEWDRAMTGEALAQREDGWVDLVGETTYDQMLGAILGASLVVGYPAGNTILATALKIPTVLLWHGYFDKRFWTNACPPNVPYQALNTVGLAPETLLATAAEVMGKVLV